VSGATLLLRREAGVLHVTLNRPGVRNAMSMAMVLELREALAAAQADGTTRVLVLRGAGGYFCAGADLRDMGNARTQLAGDLETLIKVNAAFGDLCVAFADTGVATVAVLEGAVMGGGLGLACVVYVALAGTSSVFRLPETSLGVVPAQIAPFLVERLGFAEAKRLAVTRSVQCFRRRHADAGTPDRHRPPHRSANLCRRPRPSHSPRRTRLHGAAAAAEGHRRSAFASGHTCDARSPGP
jgi:enoyl-CoA hydratase/carnithine racemase